MAPSWNVTEPVAVSMAGDLGITVAVRVTACPCTMGLSEDTIATIVGTGVIDSITVAVTCPPSLVQSR
jgi:hypothetical protein